jgi:hypothetical protein
VVKKIDYVRCDDIKLGSDVEFGNHTITCSNNRDKIIVKHQDEMPGDNNILNETTESYFTSRNGMDRILTLTNKLLRFV